MTLHTFFPSLFAACATRFCSALRWPMHFRFASCSRIYLVWHGGFVGMKTGAWAYFDSSDKLVVRQTRPKHALLRKLQWTPYTLRRDEYKIVFFSCLNNLCCRPVWKLAYVLFKFRIHFSEYTRTLAQWCDISNSNWFSHTFWHWYKYNAIIKMFENWKGRFMNLSRDNKA